MITRRKAIQQTALLGLAAVAAPVFSSSLSAQTAPAAAPAGPFTLPPLPYAFDALEPHIDAQTMQIHHDKHHAAYVTNLNKAVAGQPALANRSVEDLLKSLPTLPESIRTAVRNNGGGHANHTLFWQTLSKNGGGSPKGDLLKAIEKKWGSYSAFQDEFTKAGTSVFGSGWAWLSLDKDKTLKIESTPNQDSLLSQGRVPLLGMDVWEHAYYLKYQNRRPDYIKAFYNVINWEAVNDQFKKASA